jgi:cysteine-S-conjugate beta-lyase
MMALGVNGPVRQTMSLKQEPNHVSGPKDLSFSPQTRLVHMGRDPMSHERAINPPIQRGSTLVFEKAEHLFTSGPNSPRKGYGLEGLSTQDRLCEALAEVSGGIGAVLCPSGLQAITLVLMAATKAGDHLLVTDNSYGPTRRFCNEVLAAYGVTTEFYDPRIGAGIEALIRSNTVLIVLESPGSSTFELQDVPTITAIARAKGVATLIDDTWSAGLYLKPFDLGVDLSMQALTKYQGGHSDLLAGAVITRDATWLARLRDMHQMLGIGTAPEDAWLILRGMRTMSLRMAHQDMAARQIANWLENRPEVAQVLHPALPSHPDHAIWQRDFAGAGGVFSIVLKPVLDAQVYAMVEAYRLFSIGFSWGGFESLVICHTKMPSRNHPTTFPAGPLVRFSIGLESVEDLIADLERGFAAMAG